MPPLPSDVRPASGGTSFLARSLAAALSTLGLLLLIVSVTMLPPLAVAYYYGDGAAVPFMDTFTLTLAAGLLCWLPFRGRPLELRNRQGFLIVVLFWVALSVLSALPFMLAKHPHMPFTDAIFEATSGLTTTGATVLSHLDTLPHAILYYRAQLNFLGGMGIVVLAVAILPMFGIGGMQLYKAETPGPMKDEKLTPRIRETAKRLWLVYISLVVACAVAFWAAGMGPFDAITHSFATLALGGFSTHSASIGYFHSTAIEVVGGVFTVLAGVNFALYFTAWNSWSLKPLLRNPEFRFYIATLAIIVTFVCTYLFVSGRFSLWDSIAHGFFQATSVTADNGLVTAGYPNWPHSIVLLLLFASFFGGSVGSTCGGIKAIRFLLLYKQSAREIRLLIHPAAQFPVKVGRRAMPERVIEAVWGFYFLYIFSYCVLSFGLTLTGVDFVTAFGSVAGCINNMGVGLAGTASDFGSLNNAAKWLLWFAMLLGRLELFPLFLLVSREFWR
ncbi:MAG: TrkH family potassium uptake protein [Gammaproteobacteria bacterium]